jgi:methionine salvage enolase-phosphatase E1
LEDNEKIVNIRNSSDRIRCLSADLGTDDQEQKTVEAEVPQQWHVWHNGYRDYDTSGNFYTDDYTDSGDGYMQDYSMGLTSEEFAF